MSTITGPADIPGTHYVFVHLHAAVVGVATAIHDLFVPPFAGNLLAVDLYPSLAVSGTDTNSRNLNLRIATTEIANVDFESGTDEVANTVRALFLRVVRLHGRPIDQHPKRASGDRAGAAKLPRPPHLRAYLRGLIGG